MTFSIEIKDYRSPISLRQSRIFPYPSLGPKKILIRQNSVLIPDEKCQCSVCWDDFKLGEEVRQLKCEHIFHEDCIIPWLELHNTCPVCRKEQAEVDQENQPQVSGETASNSASNSQNLAASNSRASNQGSNSELMEALGHSMSVFNSLFG